MDTSAGASFLYPSFFLEEKIEKSVESSMEGLVCRLVLIVFYFVIFIIFLLYNPESILICLVRNF